VQDDQVREPLLDDEAGRGTVLDGVRTGGRIWLAGLPPL
jgi:hypothetical protein